MAPSPAQTPRLIVQSLLDWFARNARDLPWRRTRDPYAIWVSEIMLQQTQVKTVLSYWERWMRELPGIPALAKAHPEQLHKLWEGLGYYTRVRNMQKAAQFILQRHGGQFPEQWEAVLELPGIGRYTAGAICSIAFNQPTPILDGNVIRVLTRLFALKGNPRKKPLNDKLWRLAEQLVQKAAQAPAARLTHHASRITPPCSALNQALMELGALVCTPRQPRCEACPVARYCTALKQNRVEKFPALEQRPPATPRQFVAFVVCHHDRWLVRRRPAGLVNAHLWEFPNVEVTTPHLAERQRGTRRQAPTHPPEQADGTSALLSQVAHEALGFAPQTLEPLCRIKHTITRYRITLEVFRATLDRAPRATRANAQWLKQVELHRLPFSSAHKQILQQLEERKNTFVTRDSSG